MCSAISRRHTLIYEFDRELAEKAARLRGIETPMSPGRGSHVTDGKQDLSTLKIQYSMGNLVVILQSAVIYISYSYMLRGV